MVTFKDFIQSDNKTFFNIDEFGDLHELDGVQMEVVVDSDSFNEFSARSAEMENDMQGIYQSAITIYVKTTDYAKPEVRYRLKLDGHYFFVTSVSESVGLLKINLVSNES